jgi:hypothetical protein
MILTKHENVTFTNTTIYISGQAFIRCTFVGCTLVLRESVYHMDQCRFDRCNWHIDRTILWGSPESLRDIKSLIDMLEKDQQRQAEQLAKQQGTQAGGENAGN